MDKETLMKFMNTGAKVSAVLTAVVLLTACNGNNPFKGGSNPVKDYPSANEGIPYKSDGTAVVESTSENVPDAEPTVSFTNLPESIALSTESVDFQIVIDDPASDLENAPDIKQVGFAIPESKEFKKALNASLAVKCDEVGQFVEGTKWLFNCNLKLADIKRIKLTSTKDQKASFFVIAESKRNVGKTSIPTTANILITAVKAGE